VADLVWTRAAADWDADRVLLVPHIPSGVRIVRLPCISTSSLPVPELKPPTPDHVLFTSPTAVAQTFKIPSAALAVRAATSVWTFGAQTAARLAELGVKARLVDEAKTAEAFGAYLTRHLPKGATVLLPAPEAPAYDLAGKLRGGGFTVTPLICYRTIPEATQADGKPLSKDDIAAFGESLAGVVAFASPSAVQGFADAFLSEKGVAARLKDALVAIVIGPTTANAAMKRFSLVFAAKESSAAALAEAAVLGLNAPPP
jgi:uroporphyrinogen-III synthase